jgi:hypothetical protein
VARIALDELPGEDMEREVESARQGVVPEPYPKRGT